MWTMREVCRLTGAQTWPSLFTDLYFSGVSLLMHMDGSNGSTTFVDSSNTPKAITSTSATITTANFLFGTGSASFSGSGYLTVPYSSSMDMGTGDFTIEYFVRPSSVSAQVVVLSIGGYPNGMETYFGGGAVCFAAKAGSSAWAGFDANVDCAINTWTHCAFVRETGVVKIYVNGIFAGSSSSHSGSISSNSNPTWIGSRQSQLGMSGLLDELRITKGVARYTADFTPPAVPFSDF
jgi:hypothetical protein